MIRIIILAAMLPLLSGCDKQTPSLYEVGIERDFDIPAGLNNIETHYLYLRNVPTFYKQYADSRGLDNTTIASVRAARGLIRSDFQTFGYDFIDRISISVVSRKDPLQKREMYYLDDVPFNTGDELRMLSSATELKDIISEEFVDIEVRMNIRTSTGTAVRSKLIFSYAVF